MDLTVISISAVTSNGNRIVKLQNRSEQETALGKMRKSTTYYVAVEATSLKVEVDQQISLDPASFSIVERPFENPETGEEMMLKWLHLK